MSNEVLSREQFRDLVFRRDGGLCVICKLNNKVETAVDAHHIMERRLFPETHGYYLDNGASVCENCHILCEQTLIDCHTVRRAANIQTVVLPEHLDPKFEYDKWGNTIVDFNTRCRGELFYDEGVQKILSAGNMLHLFTNRVKYPRTYHLPYSPGLSKSDRQLTDISVIENADEIIITEKYDGENTTLYNDYIHARSLEYCNHTSRNWIKNLHARIAHEIPETFRICGENLYAKHSIGYDSLESFFLVFSIWDGSTCLDWNSTVEYSKMLGLCTVNVIFRGKYNKSSINNIIAKMNTNLVEGFVVRNAGEFELKDFRYNVAKYVRANHVTTDGHWRNRSITLNKIQTSEQ